jgi:hypothetical protein
LKLPEKDFKREKALSRIFIARRRKCLEKLRKWVSPLGNSTESDATLIEAGLVSVFAILPFMGL